MWKTGWANAVLYGIFTALALALVFVFTSFLADRIDSVLLAILTVGGALSGAIVAYFALRWYLSTWLSREMMEQATRLVTTLGAKFSSDDAAPLYWRDVKDVARQVGVLGPDLWHYARSVLAIVAFMAVTVELLALANAAMMYVQAQRIQEQNQLLEIQNRAQLAAFLNDVLASIGTTNAVRDEVRRVRDVVVDDLVSNFDVIDPLVTERTEGRVVMRQYRPEVCEGEPDNCDDMALRDLVMLANAGSVLVTEDNAAGVRGYARLSIAAELVVDQAFIPTRDLSEAIAEAVDTCSPGNRDLTQSLWRGIAGLGAGAGQMFGGIDTVAEIVPGVEIEVSDVNEEVGAAPGVLLMAASLGLLAQTVGREDTQTMGPREASVVLATGLRRLREELESIVDRCQSYQEELEGTVFFLNEERSRVLDMIGGAREGES